MFKELFNIAGSVYNMADAVVSVPMKVAGAALKPLGDGAQFIKNEIEDLIDD